MVETYGIDNHGFIITKVSLNKIDGIFKETIQSINKLISTEFKDEIESLYIYGSVVTWNAVIKKSDLDLIFVVKWNISLKVKNDIVVFSNKLSKKYSHLFSEVSIETTTKKEILNDKYGWWCFIKHLCICLSWDDLWKEFTKFKPSIKVAKAFNGDIWTEIQSAINKVNSWIKNFEFHKLCNSTMKKIVRTWFSLVMPQENSWTTQLEKSYEVFSKYYPEKAHSMKFALDSTKSNSVSEDQFLIYLNEFGYRLIKEFHETIT